MTGACAAAIVAGPAHAGDVATAVGPSADAYEVASFMAERQGLTSGRVIYLPDATADNIAALFPKGGDRGRLAKAADGEIDRAVFYFAGPGARGDDGKAYIVDANGGPRFPLDSVLAGLKATGAKQAVVVLESDFGDASINPPVGVTVLMAAIPGETAQRDKGAGLGAFTMALLEGATSDTDSGGGRVSVGEVADFAAATMRRWAAVGPDRTTQTPVVIGDDKVALFTTSSERWRFHSPGADHLDTSWVDQALADRQAGSGARAERLTARSPPTPPAPPAPSPRGGAAITASKADTGKKTGKNKAQANKPQGNKTHGQADAPEAPGAARAAAADAAKSEPVVPVWGKYTPRGLTLTEWYGQVPIPRLAPWRAKKAVATASRTRWRADDN
jgi:hypothetical protein